MTIQQSVRAQIIERRTYLRPLNANGTVFETPAQAWRRVIDHQRWLWERAQDAVLTTDQEAELEELYTLFMDRKVTVSGRTRWLGGTEVAKQREASQFNCSFGEVQTVHDVVDTIWLLLQGCGVGFRANIGVLNGFTQHIDELEVIRSTKVLPKDDKGNPVSDPALKGAPNNVETFVDGVWTIVVGDSAEAWAKFFGKLLAFKKRAKKLVVDLSQIRPAGYRLSGYGWISSGDQQIAVAIQGIFKVLNRSAGQLLSAIDILDIENHLGTILSSRRSAEIALYPFGGPEWEEFATAKKDHFLSDETKHRAMSNNSLVFEQKPTRRQLKKIFKLMEEAGGSEPGFINGVEAVRRAPYFKGVNPCAEILLGDKSFCNLVETALSRFNGNEEGLHRAHYLVSRANYRQTCVDLRDGVLQHTWHELNDFLRLCGVGVTAVVGWEFSEEAGAWEELREVAHAGANGMADELGMPHPKLITTIKPSGTQTKVFGVMGDELGEGVHKPLGRFIFNNVNFSASDPIIPILEAAGYDVTVNPYDATGCIAKFPVEYTNMQFDKITKPIKRYRMTEIAEGDALMEGDFHITETAVIREFVEETEVEVNLESAISQLDRYKLVQDHYVDHNCSITISYDLDEVPDIIDWLMDNWTSYVGVSFIYRNDPTKTAADLGYPYLPQEVVDEETFRTYMDSLNPVDLSGTDLEEMLDIDDCVTGACPVR